LDVQVGGGGAVGLLVGDRVEGVGEGGARVLAGQLQGALAGRGQEGRDVDEGLDLGVVGGGLADDVAAVGVAYEDLRALDVVEDRAQGGGVGGRTAQRVGGGDDRVAVGAQVVDDAVPAGTVGEGAVLQDDRRLGAAAGVRGTGGLGRAVGGAAESERPESQTRRDRRDDARHQPFAAMLTTTNRS